ncbi:hypothetical protein, partial [Piscirickettsia litoralis]|uniref:hypothetical protein n=1 Tax=Piscirickettsia litoralis TaxID=1891921 RepID=UPI0013016C4B
IHQTRRWQSKKTLIECYRKYKYQKDKIGDALIELMGNKKEIVGKTNNALKKLKNEKIDFTNTILEKINEQRENTSVLINNYLIQSKNNFLESIKVALSEIADIATPKGKAIRATKNLKELCQIVCIRRKKWDFPPNKYNKNRLCTS